MEDRLLRPHPSVMLVATGRRGVIFFSAVATHVAHASVNWPPTTFIHATLIKLSVPYTHKDKVGENCWVSWGGRQSSMEE